MWTCKRKRAKDRRLIPQLMEHTTWFQNIPTSELSIYVAHEILSYRFIHMSSTSFIKKVFLSDDMPEWFKGAAVSSSFPYSIVILSLLHTLISFTFNCPHPPPSTKMAYNLQLFWQNQAYIHSRWSFFWSCTADGFHTREFTWREARWWGNTVI